MANARHAEDRKTKVFVSYSRKDRDSVRRLTTALEADGEIDVLLDTEDILPTEEWRARLEGLIAQADTVVFCLTPRSAVSEVCVWEVATAERLNKRIAPIVVEEVDGQVPGCLAKLNYIFFTGRDDFETALAKLREALDADIEWIREHTRIGELARRWDTEGRRRTDLLRGQSLIAAETWLINQPAKAPAPTALHREFTSESRRAATRRKNGWIAGSITVAAAASLLAFIALWQRGVAVEQRTEATARQLSAEAQVVLSDPLAEPKVAVRDLLISLSLSPSDAATEALAVGTSRLPPRRLGILPWPNDAKQPRLMAFSSDGAWLGIVTTGEAMFWDVEARRLVLRQPLATLDGTPSLIFANGAPRALVTQRAEPGSSGAAWTAIDLATGRIETATSDHAWDVVALESDILALRKLGDGAQAEIADLMTGSVLQRVELAPPSAAPVFGRFYRASAVPSNMSAMMPSSSAPLPTPEMVLLVDDGGLATVAEIGAAGPTIRIDLPEGALPLAVDAAASLLALRLPGAGDALIRLPTGEVIWRAQENAQSFRGFAGGGRFLVVEDDFGVRLQSIEGGLSVGVEHGRRTDYDLAALNDLAQYTPIVSAEIAEQSGLIVTARKDGRVVVWRPGTRPRYGAIGGMPMPTFEPVASFDHGDTLGGIESLWTAAQPLFVSADGRYVASQSLGIETNPAGGITKFEPLMRIWDSRYAKEIARFRPGAPMLAAFATSHGLMATKSAEQSATSPDNGNIDITLWDLSDRGPPVEESLESRSMRLTPGAASAQADTREARAASEAMFSQQSSPIWVGADFKLRVLDSATGAIVLVDDLTPALRELAKPLAAGAEPPSDEPVFEARESEPTIVTGEDTMALLARLTVGWPAETPLPFFPVAVSADGRRAAVAFGSTARLYALDGPPRLLRSFNSEPGGLTMETMPLGLALSPDGEALAVMLMMPPREDAPPPVLLGMPPAPDVLREAVDEDDAIQEEVHARHILVGSEVEAKKVIAELAGGADFATLARERSVDPSARSNGGDLGFFRRDQMVPEFTEAAFALEAGEHTKEPVQTQFGWHVIEVLDRRMGTLSPEETQPRLPRVAPEQGEGAPDPNVTIPSIRLLVYRADRAAPIHDLPQQVVVMPPMIIRSLEQMIALGPEGRRILVDEIMFRSDQQPPKVQARLKVRDLTTAEEVLLLPARDLSLMPALMGADYTTAPVAAFDKEGSRFVVIEDRPDCPMMRVTTESALPVEVPSCPDRRTTLSVWSLRSGEHGRRVAATSFVTRRPQEAKVSPGLMVTTRLPNSARIALDEADPPEVSFDGVVTRVLEEGDGLDLEMTRMRRRISLAVSQAAVDDACARLPRPLAQLDQAAWATLVPAESYREICPSDATSK